MMIDLARFISRASADANFRWLMNRALLPIKVFSMAANILFLNSAPPKLSKVAINKITEVTPSQNLLPSSNARMNNTIITASLISP